MNKFMTSAKDFFASPGNPDALLRKYSQQGDSDGVARALSEHKAGIDSRGNAGETALHIASAYGHLAVAQYLVHAGADINLKTKGGQTACDLANKNRKGTVVQMLSLYMKAQNEERERLEREAEEKRQRIKAIQESRDAALAAQSIVRQAVYTHSDGTTEIVRVVKEHAASEGGAVSIFIPSLDRERQTVAERINFDLESHKVHLDSTTEELHCSTTQAEAETADSAMEIEVESESTTVPDAKRIRANEVDIRWLGEPAEEAAQVGDTSLAPGEAAPLEAAPLGDGEPSAHAPEATTTDKPEQPNTEPAVPAAKEDAPAGGGATAEEAKPEEEKSEGAAPAAQEEEANKKEAAAASGAGTVLTSCHQASQNALEPLS